MKTSKSGRLLVPDAPPKKKRLQAVRDFIIIRPDAPLKVGVGMIVIPDSALDEKNPLSGTVISVGCGLVEGGVVVPLVVKVGDYVTIPRNAGTLIKDHPVIEDCFIVRENQVMGRAIDA